MFLVSYHCLCFYWVGFEWDLLVVFVSRFLVVFDFTVSLDSECFGLWVTGPSDFGFLANSSTFVL